MTIKKTTNMTRGKAASQGRKKSANQVRRGRSTVEENVKVKSPSKPVRKKSKINSKNHESLGKELRKIMELQ